MRREPAETGTLGPLRLQELHGEPGEIEGDAAVAGLVAAVRRRSAVLFATESENSEPHIREVDQTATRLLYAGPLI